MNPVFLASFHDDNWKSADGFYISSMYDDQFFHRFHELSEFDEAKRSCRRRLAGHNERRRKGASESQNAEGSGGKEKENQCRQAEERAAGRVEINLSGTSSYKHFQIRWKKKGKGKKFEVFLLPLFCHHPISIWPLIFGLSSPFEWFVFRICGLFACGLGLLGWCVIMCHVLLWLIMINKLESFLGFLKSFLL